MGRVGYGEVTESVGGGNCCVSDPAVVDMLRLMVCRGLLLVTACSGCDAVNGI
jgi:hypothetical protein